ncbi:sugar ABC transporter substrate-binding protein [Lentzea sp. NBRC 105346]|uniref:sugar ABC transporter substrate-binding protein n=1 Tax=Lentzea sp. NBRC 105346 TaxID=3032205 RepID=UPI00255663C8|nr:sugar ABC transporter substrate-binding protein [Lentzea sp. NBRC 105346]
MLVAALSGCGTEKTSADRPTIGFLSQNTSRDFSNEMSDGFGAGARIAGGVESITTGPPTHDGLKQVELFRDLTTKAKGGIAVSAVAPELLAGPMAEAKDSGIPLIAVAGGQIAPGAGVKLLLENDNYELGRMLADEAIKRLPSGSTGKIVLGNNSPAQPALDQRAQGMRDRFTEKLPNVRVTGPSDTQRDAPANMVAWQTLVTANPDALAFLGTGDIDAVNLATIRANTGGKWLAGAFSLDPKALQGVKDGHLFALVSAEHFVKGAIGGWLLAQRAKDVRKLPEGWLVTPGLVVSSSNVDDIVKRQAAKDKQSFFQPQIDAVISDIDRFLRPLDQVR